MKEQPRCEINVTPLVDVCLVMLIIFMVVTPMVVERVTLATTAHPDETKPDRKKQIRLVVGYPHADLWLEEERVEESLLLEKLRTEKADHPEKKLVVLADARLDMNEVRRAMRISFDAGYRDFGLIVQRKAESR